MTTAANMARLFMDLRREGVTDQKVLEAIEAIPRDRFVPDAFSWQAYDNKPLPIGDGQTISQPLVVGLMTQALEVGPRHRVLEIGTGSGYQAAVLARLCRRVYTIERHRRLLAEAEARFAALGLKTIVTRLGDGHRGWPEAAPFDRVMVTAAAESFPVGLAEQLADGGVMVVPVGPDGGIQDLVVARRSGDVLDRQSLMAVRFVPLVAGLPRPPADG